jgi:hypothetical protein
MYHTAKFRWKIPGCSFSRGARPGAPEVACLKAIGIVRIPRSITIPAGVTNAIMAKGSSSVNFRLSIRFIKGRPWCPFPGLVLKSTMVGRLPEDSGAEYCRQNLTAVTSPHCFFVHLGSTKVSYLIRRDIYNYWNMIKNNTLKTQLYIDAKQLIYPFDSFRSRDKYSHGLQVMPGLRDLPAELLLHVYQLLDDIDDALHLARTCNRLYRAFNHFNDPTNGRGILKSIIVRYRSRHFMALYVKASLY